jgi:hypothetical protein
MGVGQWMRVIDTVSGLVQMSGRFRRGDDGAPAGPGGPAGGPLETRLAGVLVAALKEAFDRDRARMDLERTHLDAERQRAEEALRAELRRQAGERILSQLRLVAVMAFVICVVSVAVGVWLPGMRDAVPRGLMGTGLALAIAALGAAMIGWQQVSSWSADAQAPASGPPIQRGASAAPWLLLGSLALTAASLLSAL